MMKGNQMSGGIEWRVNMPDGTSEILQPKSTTTCGRLRGLCVDVFLKLWRFLEKAWNLGKTEPRKVIHCLKVGVALSLVSLFYYMRPLYDGVGGNAMWAVMTVVVVFEYTVGATLCKSVNRAVGTFLAGTLGIGVHWIASKSGEKFEPIILQTSVFLLATAATFSRFIPSIKAQFDYGCMIFILTFSLVSVSSYRVDELVELAQQRLSTIAIGTSICIFTTMLFCPVWAGDELHHLICCNIQKLADSLDDCVAEYLENDGAEDAVSKKIQGYKCVLNSKATEESMATLAKWEPTHGNFNFRHPWNQYLKVGASLRNCAYYIETLNSSINSEDEAPDALKKHLGSGFQKLGSSTSYVLKELATMMKTMTKSSKIGLVVEEMNSAVQELQNALKSLPNQSISLPLLTVEASSNDTKDATTKVNVVPLAEIVPLIQVASVLTEIAEKVEEITKVVDQLASQAEFEPESTMKPINSDKFNPCPSQSHCSGQSQVNITMTTFQRV